MLQQIFNLNMLLSSYSILADNAKRVLQNVRIKYIQQHTRFVFFFAENDIFVSQRCFFFMVVCIYLNASKNK